MIQLWDTYSSRRFWVRAEDIRQVIDEGTHHGAKALVVLADDRRIFVGESAKWILDEITSAKEVPA